MTEAVTEAELDALFDNAQESIFRLETLPTYSVAEETERIEAWRAGRPRPEQSVRTSGWLAEIAASTLGGVRWDRVRVIDDPLTWYQRYQLHGYVEAQAAGCSMWIAKRADVPDTWSDGYLFDAGTERAAGVGLRYTDAGEFIGLERWSSAGLTTLRDAAFAAAVPLNDYLVMRCAE